MTLEERNRLENGLDSIFGDIRNYGYWESKDYISTGMELGNYCPFGMKVDSIINQIIELIDKEVKNVCK